MSKKQCYHCNEVCINEITHDNKSFCCLGCKTVYQILHDNQMDFYYSIENNPGIRAHNAPENLIYLDDPVHIQPFILYEDDRIVRASFTIPSIHCAACVWLLENMFKLNNNLLNLEVNLGERSFSFSYIKDQISFREIVELLIKIGYSPSLNDHHKGDSQKKIQTAYIAKLAVAGFCFGNIMLFSFPAYFGIDKNSFMGQSFDWLNIIFSIPILLYCSIPFYTDALVSIRTKQMSLNIPIFLGIIALAIQTFWEIFTQTGHGYADSLAGLIFFLLLGRWIQNRSIDYLNFERDYKSFFPIWVEKYEPDYLTTHVSIQELEKGDHYKVKAQCIIPVDSILKSKKALIDYSFVSGEAHPVAIKEGQKIFAGGRQLGSSIELLVDRNLSSSYLSRIWDQMNKTVTTQQTILNFMSKYFTLSVIIISLLAGFSWYLIAPSKVVMIVVSVLIVACPCALAISFPFTSNFACLELRRRGLFINCYDKIEELSNVNHIIFDKTGTILTKDSLPVENFPNGLSFMQQRLIASVVYESEHPLSQSIFLAMKQDNLLSINSYHELPGHGIHAKAGDYDIKLGKASFLGIKDDSSDLNSAVHININGHYLGYFEFETTLRPGLKELFNSLQNYKLHIISGDHAGDDDILEKLSPEHLIRKYNMKPDEKANYIEKIKHTDKNAKILMIGDGLNDGPAFMASDFSIAICNQKNQYFPSSDAMLEANSFHEINQFLLFAKRAMKLVKLNFFISFVYNFFGLSFACLGLLSPLISAIFMPVSSLTVIFISQFGIFLLSKQSLRNLKFMNNELHFKVKNLKNNVFLNKVL